MGPEENELERALRRAAGDPSYRPEFYAILVDSMVYVVGEADQTEATATGTVAAGTRISLQSSTAQRRIADYSVLHVRGSAAARYRP